MPANPPVHLIAATQQFEVNLKGHVLAAGGRVSGRDEDNNRQSNSGRY